MEASVQITWTAAGSLCAIVLASAAGLGWYVGKTVNAAISDLELRLYKALDEKYMPREICELRIHGSHTSGAGNHPRGE